MKVLLALCLLATALAVKLPPEYCTNEQDYYTIPQVHAHSCACNAKSAGTLRYHDNKIQFCNGVRYVDVGKESEIGSEDNPGKSCRDILKNNKNAKSGVYYLKQCWALVKAYCYMGEMCGSRGWTMIMKIDGSKNTFHYNSKYWTNKQPYNAAGASGGLDNTEVKLDTYSHTPFSKLCLGLKTAGVTKWMTLEYRAASLYALIADGRFRETHNGRNAWKSLIRGSSLQRNCNREGFNVLKMARIGIVSNQENDCNTPDSRIGFGTGGNRCGQNDKNSAGNEARCSPDNGDKSIKSFGYIFAQEQLKDAPMGSFDKPASSCKAIKSARSGAGNGVYYLNLKGKVTRVYCHMDVICGSRGWTILLKMDGNKQLFNYDSVYWKTHHVYNVEAIPYGLNTNQEMKLSTYSTFPFSKLCLGMRVGRSTRWLSVPKKASSLYSVIAGNRYQATSLGRNAWKSLVSASSLQRNCNREGFNVQLNSLLARIGIVSNQENNCGSPDSYVGFGIKNKRQCGLKAISTGNGAGCGPDNGNRNTPAMGFILAQ